MLSIGSNSHFGSSWDYKYFWCIACYTLFLMFWCGSLQPMGHHWRFTILLQDVRPLSWSWQAIPFQKRRYPRSLEMIFSVILGSYVYPFPIFVLTWFYVIARIIYTKGYTTGGYGKHGPGFALERICYCTTVSMLLWIAIQGFVLKVDADDNTSDPKWGMLYHESQPFFDNLWLI